MMEEKTTAPQTMDDLKEELEASFRQINEGDIMTGRVVGVSDTEILVDLDYYAPGVIPLEYASDDPTFSIKANMEIGQVISATVVRRDDGGGRILLSMKGAAALVAWDRLRELLSTKENVTVRIAETNKAGAIAYLEGIRGFIPASKLALTFVSEEELPSYVGKSVEVRVITVDESEKRLVMSAREILREIEEQNRARRISNVQVGLVTEGIVETIKPYGAFVNLGNGISGLLHVSQISTQRIKHPGAVLKEGQTVKVKVIDQKDGRLSLSMKALEDIAAEEVTEEEVELPSSGPIGTSLADLLKNIHLDN